jgi:peptidyl-prolyl cis-trans isomerase SurA
MGALSAFWPARAEGAIVERVIAVVGERPILLSELRHRAHPELMMTYAMSQDPANAFVEETKVYRRVLDRLIDDLLIADAAQKAHLAVSLDDIDHAIAHKAKELNVTPKELTDEAIREGLSEQGYRDEIRRQILEGKLVQLRVAARVRVTEADARSAYESWVKELETQAPVRARIVALGLPQGATQQQVASLQVLVEGIVARAPNGDDLCQAVAPYSPGQCRTGVVLLRSLPPAAQALAIGGITSMQFGMGEIDVMQNVGREKPSPYDYVRMKMFERAGEALFQRERDVYLQELRRAVHVEIRLNG